MHQVVCYIVFISRFEASFAAMEPSLVSAAIEPLIAHKDTEDPSPRSDISVSSDFKDQEQQIFGTVNQLFNLEY